MKRIARLLAALAAICLAAAGASADTALSNTAGEGYVDIPEAAAQLKPPDGMTKSERFSGFEDASAGIEVIAALIRAPYEGIAANFNKDTLKMRGVDMLSRAEITINGRPGLLIKAQQPDGDDVWGKWILLLNNGGGALVINGVFKSGDGAASEAVEAMLKGVVPYGIGTSAPDK